MNYYYEIVKPEGGIEYMAQFDLTRRTSVNSLTFIAETPVNYDRVMMQMANRVWVEDGNTVRFIKHRFEPLPYPVEPKEFLWIKLKC